MLDFGAFFAIYQQDPLVFLRMCKGVFDCLICVKKDALRLFYYSNRGNQSSPLPCFFLRLLSHRIEPVEFFPLNYHSLNQNSVSLFRFEYPPELITNLLF
jgi:hypothetical protein